MRSSPLSTPLLHALHVARLVGASPIEYRLGRVLKPGVRPIATSCPNMKLKAAPTALQPS